MRRIWGLVVVMAAACGGSHRATKSAAPPGLDHWDLAPPGTVLALSARYGDWWDLVLRASEAIRDAPGGDRARGFLGGMLSYPHVNMRSRAARRASGVDDDGPRTEFWTRRGRVWVYRVTDRAAYDRTYLVRPDAQSRGRLTVDRDGTTCGRVEKWHVCGRREIVTDILDGKRAAIAWPSGRLPTIRVWAAPSVLGGLAGATDGGDGLRVEIDVGRGEVQLRAHLSGKAAGLLALFGANSPSPLARRLPTGELSGAAVLNLTGWFQRTREQMVENLGDARVTTHVSKGDLVAALRGDAVMWAMRGDRGAGIAVGLERADIARRLIADCEELADRIAGLRVARDGTACRIRHDALAELGAGEITVKVVDDSLTAEVAGSGGAPAAPPRVDGRGSAMLERIRSGDDGVAMWGAGLVALPARANLEKRKLAADPFFLWLFIQVTEVGGAVRIDPDGVRAELAIRTAAHYQDAEQVALSPLLGQIARGQAVAADAFARLAAAHPRSQLAVDLSQGKTGSLVPVVAGAFVGVAGAVLARELTAAARAGEEVVAAYEDVVEAACRCKEAECADRAIERYHTWEEKHGQTKVDTLSLARIRELSQQLDGCLAPFVSDDEGSE